MASKEKNTVSSENNGEFLVAWQKYTARGSDELTLNEGDVVELIETEDNITSSKRLKLDPGLDVEGELLLDSSAAKHKLAVKPNRKHTSSRQSPTRNPLNARWLVREVKGQRREGWVPCQILQSTDEPVPGSGLPGDAAFRRQAVVKELVETEQEFVRDLDYVVQKYLIGSEREPRKPKIIKDNFDLIFGNLKEISEFHRTVLMEGVKYYANEPHLLGKAFLRLERDFDKHVNYCKEEPLAQSFLDTSDIARDYFDELSHRLGDDKTISEHLKLPIQRINDYQLLLKELVRYSACLGEDNSDLQKALELMLSVPHRAQDDKFTNSIEGYRGNIHKLGRLIAHDWFSVTLGDTTKERYLFLFKARVLISKVRRISDDRSVFQLKDIIRLPQVEVRDHPENDYLIELSDKVAGQSLLLTAHRENVKEFWLKEFKLFASEVSADESSGDDLQLISEPTSPPGELAPQTTKVPEKAKAKLETSTKKSDQTTEKRKSSVTADLPSAKRVESTKEVIVDKPKTVIKEESAKSTTISTGEKVVQSQVVSVKQVTSTEQKVVTKTEVGQSSKSSQEATLVDQKLVVTSKSDKSAVAKSVQETVSPVEKKLETESVKVIEVENTVEVKKATESAKTPEVVKAPEKTKDPETVKAPAASKPTESIKLTEPTKTVESTKPVESIKPVEAIKPVEPTKIVKPAKPVEVTKTVEATKKVEPAKTVEPTKPIEPTKTVEPTKPVEVSKPVEPTKTVEPAKTVELAKTVEATKKVEPAKTVEPTKPVEVSKPVEPTKTVEPAKTVELAKTVEATKKVEPAKTVEPTKTVEVTKPVEQTKTVEPAKPVEVTKVPEPTKVTETKKSPETAKVPESVKTPETKKQQTEPTKVPQSTKVSEPIKTSDTPKTADLVKPTAESKPVEAANKEDGTAPKPKLVDPQLSKVSASVKGADHKVTKANPLLKSGSYQKLTERDTFTVQVDVGLNIADEDIMSRKYTSAYGTTDAYGESSSYSRSSVRKSSYSTDTGLSSSRYGTESVSSSKYGSESSLAGKYGTETSLSGKYGTESSLTGKYGTETSVTGKYGTETSTTGRYSADSSLTGSKYDEISSKYSRNLSTDSDKYGETGGSYSARRTLALDGGDVGDSVGSFSRRSIKTSERRSVTDLDDSGAYSYKRRGVRSSVDEGLDEGATDSYLSKRTLKSTTSIEEDYSPDAYVSKAKSREDNEAYSYKRTTSRDEDESKSYQRSTSITNDEDRLARFEKYSRKSSDVSEQLETSAGKYKRTDSNTSTSHESFQTLADTTVVSGKVLSEAAESSSISATLRGSKKDPQGMAPPDDKPKFTKTHGGTHIKPGESALFEIKLADTPDSLTWLKDNRNFEGTLAKRANVSSLNEHRTWRLAVTNAENKDTGIYTAVAVNAFGKSTCTARLIVHTLTEAEQLELKKPGFTVKLKDAELLEDTYLRFMIKVKGDPHPSLTFYKDGVQISEKNERVSINRDGSDHDFYELVIPDVKPLDAGVYKCVAKNEHGEESTEGVVTVASSTHLFDDLADKEGPLPAGEKPAFIWKRDGVEIEPEERFKVLMGDDEDSLALIFQHVKPEDAGMYTCVAQTSSGHISCSAELTVQGQVYELHREPEKPQLIIEKREALTTTGGSCMLELQVKGFPRPKVTWTHEGKPVEPGSKYKFLHEDEEGLSLVIKNVEGADAGVYQITAENELGKDIREMNLVVKAPPKVKNKIVDTAAAAEQHLKMTVEIEGIPRPTVQFYKDGKPIKPDEHMKVVEEGDKYSIVIDKTNLKDSGAFSVVLQNELAQVSQFWDLNVYCAPKILKKLGENRIVSLKDTVELTVEMESQPEAEVIWYKNDVEIKSDEHVVISKDGTNYKLKISGSVSTDSALYKMKAKNIHGSVEDSCRVDVRRQPSVVKGLENMTVTEGDTNVTFDIKIDAFPKPTVKWFLDEIELTETRTEFTRVESAEGAKLVIKEVDHKLSGQYTCKFSNDLGETSTSAKLTVHCKPRIIKQLKNTTVEEGATLKLEVEVDSCPEATGVKWLRNGQEVSADARITITRDKQRLENYHLSVNLIKYEEEGEYEIQITNAIGTVSSKSTVTVQKVIHTDAIEVNEPPLKLVIEEVEEEPQKAKRAGHFDIEVIEQDDEPEHVTQTDTDTPQKSGGTAYDKLEIEEVFMIEDVDGPQPIVEEEVEKSKRGKSVQFQGIEIVEIEKDQTPTLDDNDKLDSQKATLSDKESADIIESKDDRKTFDSVTLEQEKPQKGSREVDEEDDDDLEDLLNRAKKQRSMVEDVDIGDSVEDQALPKVLESNMKDCSQFESLGTSFVVKAWANPPPVATWTCDDKELKQGNNLRFTIGQSGDEYRLDIVKLDPKDAGVYELKLSNPVGDVKEQAKLEVIPEAELRRPKVKEGSGLQDQDVLKKKQAVLTATIIGDPVPEITWSFKGKEITQSQIDQHKMVFESKEKAIENDLKECTFSLTIPRCERQNGGKYTISAKNKWGVIDNSGILNIVLAPEIEGPDFVKVIPGKPIQLQCIVESNPPAIVTWTKSENVIESTDNIEIVEDVPNETYTMKIKKAQLSDEGYYKVYAKNEYGQSDSEGKIRLINPEPSSEKPQFITGLQETLVDHGGEVSLMVRADGLPRPDLTWYLNDKPIENPQELQYVMTSDRQLACTLTITDWDQKDAGIYKVTATSVVGNVETSALIGLHQTPPSFVHRLERSIELNEEDPLLLKAKVTGSPKPTVCWVKDNEKISPNDPRIKTELLPDGTVTLKIDEITAADSGAYKLIVKNDNGDTSGLCGVVVIPRPQRPKFTKCIKDTRAMIGEPLTLTARVSGHPPPEIKWLKDGQPIRASSNIHMEHHPDGTVVLVVDSVRPENAGKYSLVVSNKLGDITGEAKVDIEKRPIRPEFVKKLYAQTVIEGFPAKFEVKVVGFPEPTIRWTRNGVEIISDSKHIKIIDLPDGCSTLVLDACNESRDGLLYKAIASNDAGETETCAQLTVSPANNGDDPEERPMLLHGLRDVITDEGCQLKLEAPFTSNPIPSIEWRKDGVPIEASDRILLLCDGKRIGLCIDIATSADAGQYSVLLSNPLGKDSSEAKASVHKVFSPPSFLQRFTDLQQVPNRAAKFPVRVSGVPQPDVVWTKDGEVIGDSDQYRIKRDGDSCCLYISECKPEDEGVYKATATNKEGSDFCQAKLEIVNEINSTQKIEPAYFVKRIGDTLLYKSMTAKFTACAGGIPEPTVEWYRNDQRMYHSERIRMERDLAGLLRLTVAGVDQDDLGRYSCKIYNEHGSDICHAELRFDDGVPDTKSKRDQYTEYDKYKQTGAPMPLSDPPIVSRMTDRHCTISWKPSIPSGPRAPVTYQLEMLEMPGGDWFTVRTGIRSCVCGVSNLEPFRDYKFRIRVENKYGISDPSPYALTHREKLEPDAPRFIPYLPPGIDFRPETSPYFPKDFDIDRPPHDNMSQAPKFLRQENDAQYGVKDQSTNLFWFVYGYPKPRMQYYFNDELVDSGGRFDSSYTRNGQATLFINKMLERDVGWYEAVATNEHGEARQRVRLEIAEVPTFIRRPDIEYCMMRNSARFEARIIGVPYPEIKWYKDWKPVASSSRIKILFSAPDIATLIINDSIYKDEGLYSVSARNVAGSVSSSAMLYIDENDLEYNLHTYKTFSPIKLKKKSLSDAYDLGDELGRGTQGVTYHAVERINGRNYAAKVMHGRGDLKPMMHNELDVLNQLRHRRLISLHDSYEHEDQLALILELAAGGELVKDYLIKKDWYTESEIAGYMRQILQGLDYMHGHGFAHLGLNISDLLLSHPGSDELKITDFGLSRRITMGRLAPLKYGMPEYVSPECANGEGVGLGHDMWSVGIITYILLSGRSPFRGANDMETLTKIQSGKWLFEEEWWSRMSLESRDFISKLLVYHADGRMDVHTALRHPWLEKCDKIWQDEYQISTKYLRDYYSLYKEWYDVANCRLWFRRKPLEGAFHHPSKMVYVPGERYTPPPTEARKPISWEDKIPTRSPLNYEIGAFKSESHYQNGPDTYLLQLRDVDFPVRLREYMKVAASRGPGISHILSDENGYDWRTPIIRERRRFTDIMDEEIDDERKSRINRYGTGDRSYTVRRLRHEIGTRLETYAEAEAYLESKMDGRLPFFREKPQIVAMQEGKEVKLSCLAVGEPKPIIQWFKNDAIIAESHRVSITTDDQGRSHLTLSPALSFDLGMYKVVARNKVGQTICRTRVVLGMVPDAPDSPSAAQISDDEALLTWKQPKCDGHAAVVCYSLQYKQADEIEWIEQARNIDHEFYYMRGLEPAKNYIFRLAARNRIGWSEQGVASGVIMTHPTGAAKVQMSRAMMHLQQITDGGAEPEIDSQSTLDYAVETAPIDWDSGDVKDHYSFVSELSSRGRCKLAPENKPAEWSDDTAHEHYNFVSQIYRGKYSTVLKAIQNKTDDLVVVKAIDMNLQGIDNLDGEFAAIRSLRHERVASLLAAYRSGDMASFVLEKLQGADVLTYLASRHEYTEQTVASIVTQVIDGLQYLHWRGLCHLDLQPDNIVMCGVRAVQVKIVDLGCAHRVTKLGNRVPIVGHPDYMSPEVLADEPAFPQSDIWSLGVLTYVMLSGFLPFRGADENESRQNILFVRYRFEHLYKEVSQEGVRFIMLLFKRHANKRPTAEECHENRWLLPTDQMIKKRERAVFLGNRLKEYSEEYHGERSRGSLTETTALAGKNILRSQSIQEELQASC